MQRVTINVAVPTVLYKGGKMISLVLHQTWNKLVDIRGHYVIYWLCSHGVVPSFLFLLQCSNTTVQKLPVRLL